MSNNQKYSKLPSGDDDNSVEPNTSTSTDKRTPLVIKNNKPGNNKKAKTTKGGYQQLGQDEQENDTTTNNNTTKQQQPSSSTSSPSTSNNGKQPTHKYSMSSKDIEQPGEQDDTAPTGIIAKIKAQIAAIKNPYLLLLLVALIIVGTLNRVTSKLQTVYIYNYPYFLSQLTTIVYIPIFFGVVWFKQWNGDSITKDMTDFPKRKFAIMGSLDATAGFLMIFGLDHISGPMSVLLIQGAIPVTMIATVTILGMRYHKLQYFGALIILVGIFISLYPSLVGGGGASGSAASLLFWNMVFFSNNIPTALSSVYKEIAFKAQSMDVMYLNAWVALFQFLLGLVLAPVAAPLQNMQLSEIPGNLWDGTKCFLLGINTITHCPANDPSCVVDDCGPALLAVSAYITANIFYNIFLLLVLKHGSAALMFIASTVIIPLANITFTFKFIMGDHASTLSGYDIGGLVVILTGLILYRSVSEGSDEPPEEGDEADPIFTMGITGNLEVATRVIRGKPVHITPRTTTTIRNAYLSRLGIKSAPMVTDHPDTAVQRQPKMGSINSESIAITPEKNRGNTYGTTSTSNTGSSYKGVV